MARQNADFQVPKSIVGAALVGLGFFILFRNLEGATELARFLRITGEEVDSLGMLTAASIAIREALQAYLFNHTEFLRALNQLLQSFSAFLLIMVGTISFVGVFTPRVKELKKKNEDMSISQPLVRRVVRSGDLRQLGQLGSFVGSVDQ
jgi:type II secretory pathway component PulF